MESKKHGKFADFVPSEKAYEAALAALEISRGLQSKLMKKSLQEEKYCECLLYLADQENEPDINEVLSSMGTVLCAAECILK